MHVVCSTGSYQLLACGFSWWLPGGPFITRSLDTTGVHTADQGGVCTLLTRSSWTTRGQIRGSNGDIASHDTVIILHDTAEPARSADNPLGWRVPNPPPWPSLMRVRHPGGWQSPLYAEVSRKLPQHCFDRQKLRLDGRHR
jgi:hypothetical protein